MRWALRCLDLAVGVGNVVDQVLAVPADLAAERLGKFLLRRLEDSATSMFQRSMFSGFWMPSKRWPFQSVRELLAEIICSWRT